jgi:outer membrane protein assembly factor BamB
MTLWKRETGSIASSFRPGPDEELSSPVISEDGVLYVGSSSGNLLAIDAEKNRRLWTHIASSPINSAPAVYEGIVCFGASDGALKCLDRLGGRVIFEFQSRSEINSSPVIMDKALYFSSADKRLYAISTETGEKLWMYSRPLTHAVLPRIMASPAYYNGRIYQLFGDGFLAAIDARTGVEAWVRKVINDFDSPYASRRTPLATGSRVYVIDHANSIIALDAETGEQRDTLAFSEAHDLLVAKDTLVYAGLSKVSAMDIPQKKILWTRDMDLNARVASVALAGDTVYVVSRYKRPFFGIERLSEERGRVTALGLSDGGLLWQRDIDSGITGAIAATGQWISFLTDDGTLEVLAQELR